MYEAVPKLSDTAADLLFGLAPDTNLGDLHKLVWQIAQAHAAAEPIAAETSMWAAMKHPPCEPEMPDLDWSSPLPVWDLPTVEQLLAEIIAA